MRRAVAVPIVVAALATAATAQERSTTAVPDLKEVSLNRVLVRLHGLGLQVTTARSFYLASNAVPEVAHQSPAAGTAVPPGTTVVVKLFQPPTISPRATDRPARVPKVTGLRLTFAARRLVRRGLLFWRVNRVPALRNSDARSLRGAYRVTGQHPAAGTILQQRRQVDGVERIYAVDLSVRTATG
jgi:beta-lactam-binding protein with PASTA domain